MSVIVHQTYRPGVIGEVIRHHALYYGDHWSFDDRFEAQVARELGEFINRIDMERDGFWWAEVDGEFAGSVVLDGSHGSQARLRWFIVPEGQQGKGVGAQLFDRAMQFAEAKGYAGVFLWTFKGLDAARYVYEKAGFRLVEEVPYTNWGPDITAQKFER